MKDAKVHAGWRCDAGRQHVHKIAFSDNEIQVRMARRDLERVRPGDPFSIRVRAPGGGALVYIDVDARALRVWRIYSTRG